MTPARAKKLVMMIVAVILLSGTWWWILLKESPESKTVYAPNQAKPTKTTTPEPQKESVQKPTAEVLSNRVAEYHLDVSLDPNENTLKGKETLTWTHPGKNKIGRAHV